VAVAANARNSPVMRAAVFDSQAMKLNLESVPVPEPGPDEVRVRVAACGICLSDVHLLDGTLPAPLPRVIPGHESAGVIDSVGEQVPEHWTAGRRVLMAGGKPCGTCTSCVAGDAPERCLEVQVMGFAYDGAWAEFTVVPWQTLVEVPDHVPLHEAAILADAVATPYAALTERAALRPAESIGLWGVGGLGVHAVQIARIVGAAPIIALDPSPVARARALELGADHALDPTDEAVIEEVWRLTDGRGLDVAVDLFGANRVLLQADACIGRGGRVVIVGLSAEDIALGLNATFGVMSHALLGHLGYRKEHLFALIRLVAHGRLDVSRSISDVLPLEDVGLGVDRLASKDGDPIRLVIAPHGSDLLAAQ
jgi:D-arabinose 1-dehydrogenase-like Zn-dependent alcohol dehydrogenase